MPDPDGLQRIDDDNPENFLSREARLRIRAAFARQAANRDKVLAKTLARLDGSPWDAAAKEACSLAKVEAGITVLSTYLRECWAAGKRGLELSNIMREQLAGMVFKLEMSNIERDAVMSELCAIEIEMEELIPAVAPVGLENIGDPFATETRRQEALDAYISAWGCKKKTAAKNCGVVYQDLNKWKNHRSLAKGISRKQEAIEKELLKRPSPNGASISEKT